MFVYSYCGGFWIRRLRFVVRAFLKSGAEAHAVQDELRLLLVSWGRDVSS